MLITYLVFLIKWNKESKANMALLGQEAPVVTQDGYRFRDLNKNGQLDPYEDSRADIEIRIDDLISQMNIEEKAGLMFITMIAMNPSGELSEVPTFKDPMTFAFESNSEMVARKKMNHFNSIQSPPSAEIMLDWHNKLQNNNSMIMK